MTYSASWEEVTATIKEQADIVQIIGEHVNLKRSGVRYLGLCPFHQEKTPSFSVHPGQQFFYCFGCGASGDVFTFVMNYNNLEFPDALKTLAQRYQIQLPEKKRSAREREQDKRRQQMFDVNKKAASCFHRFLLQAPEAKQARDYLKERGIPENLQKEYLLGYAPSTEQKGWNFLGGQLDASEHPAAIETGLLAAKQKGGSYDRFRDRVMFPILDRKGRVAGFGGRVLGNDNPKYMNSPESLIYDKSRMLFGLFHQRDAIRHSRRAVLVEGNFDLLSLIANGLETAVAPLGTALTREQIRLLKPLVDEVILLFDGDAAGIKAAERVITLFLAEQVSGRVALLPENHDPDTYVREKGLQELTRLIDAAETLPEFVVERIVSRHGRTLDGKFKIIEELKPLLAAAANPQQRSVMASHFASIVEIAPEALVEHQPRNVPRQQQINSVDTSGKNSVILLPLEGGLKSLVRFMVLNPACIPSLEEAGIQQALSGTLGEIIFLQLKLLYQKKQGGLQPEELLTELPEGEERRLVADMLLQPVPEKNSKEQTDNDAGELEEIVTWLRRATLKKKSDQLMAAISDAQKTNDFGSISEFMKEKMEIDSQLKDS